MVFSSYVFIFVFLPLVLLGFYLLPRLISSGGRLRTAQNLLLIAASLVFYGYYNVYYLFIIIASILMNYVLALAMQRFDLSRPAFAKALFILGILFNIFLIGYFKYYDFFIENINFIFRSSFALKHLLLPLGISFFTFQQLSFLVSVYKKDEKVEGFISYCIFVLFFPQLVAGPIVLYSEMIPQFNDQSRSRFNADNMAGGVYMFCIGLFKKAVIADTLALFVDNGFAQDSLGLAAAWAASLSYTLQIYFDFSGYSDMAIGLGRMFNISIPYNFLSPYKSDSFSELWRRWHITLGRALSTYIYSPWGQPQGPGQDLPEHLPHLFHKRAVARGRLDLCALGQPPRALRGSGKELSPAAVQAAQMAAHRLHLHPDERPVGALPGGELPPGRHGLPGHAGFCEPRSSPDSRTGAGQFL